MIIDKDENISKGIGIGKIPSHWRIGKLSKIAFTSSGGTPSRARNDFYGGNILWVKSGELKDNWIEDTEEKITDEGLRNSSAKVFPANTLLVALYGATVGKTALLKRDAATNQAVCAINPLNNSFDTQFLQFYFIEIRPMLLRSRAGGAQPNISQTILNSLEIILPPIPEQTAIAKILRSIQDAKEARQRERALEQERRTALMEYLLTNGTSGEQHKQTEIGEMPKTWGVAKLSNVAIVIMGQSPLGESYNSVGNGLPLINGPTEFGRKSPTPFQWTNTPTKICEPGDILFCVRGNTTGRLNIADQKYCIGRGIAAIRGTPCKADTIFIKYYLEYESDHIYQTAVGGGSTFPNITAAQLINYKIRIPGFQEQQEILNILYACDSKIVTLESEIQLFDELFQALLEKLMLGQLSVIPLIEES
jgi:type I restriction enzyme S subunit